MRGIISFIAVSVLLAFGDGFPLQRRDSSQTVLTLGAGPISGIKVSSNNYKFLGIPYAQPPVGNLRFAPPVPFPRACMADPLVATAFGSECPQATGGAEDCLTLNIFTGTVFPLALRPVMFWIHGGSFIEGTGSDPLFDGTDLAQNNVVVVTFNYRLGILGFLDGGDSFPSLNLGLQDAILALTWVRQNILFFGGDPNRVTVFGQSSGGQMIRALMASPKATNLFKRAIIESDPQMYPLEERTVSRDIVGSFALSQLNCSDVTCARGKSLSDILAATAQTQTTTPSMDPRVPVTPFSPTIDGTWVKGDWSSLIASNSLPNNVDTLIGTVTQEAAPEVFTISQTPLPAAYFQYILSVFIGASRAATMAALPQFALDPTDPDTVRKTLVRAGTLFVWSCANQCNAVTYAQTNANVFLYELTLGSTHPTNANDPLCTTGGAVCHQDDIPLVFGTFTSATTDQINLSAEIQKRWTSFAANGNPNVAGKPQWNKISSKTQLNALRLGSTDAVNQTLYADLCGPVFGNTVLYNFQIITS